LAKRFQGGDLTYGWSFVPSRQIISKSSETRASSIFVEAQDPQNGANVVIPPEVVVVGTPWLQPGVVAPPPYVPPSKAIAKITGRYYVDAPDIKDLNEAIRKRVAYGLRKWTSPTTDVPLPIEYLEVTENKLLWTGDQCTHITDPTDPDPTKRKIHCCEAVGATPYVEPAVPDSNNTIIFNPPSSPDEKPEPIPPYWMPQAIPEAPYWRFPFPDPTETNPEPHPTLKLQGEQFTFCVEEFDTTLRWANPDPTNYYLEPTTPKWYQSPVGIRITGERDEDNDFLLINAETKLWIIGRTWIYFLQLLDQRLKLKNKLLSFMPEVPGLAGSYDPDALLTEDLFTPQLEVGGVVWKPANTPFNVRIEHLIDPNPTNVDPILRIPVCRNSQIPIKGCSQVEVTAYDYPTHISNYKLRFAIQLRPLLWLDTQSHPFLEVQDKSFNFTWLLDPPKDEEKLWHVDHFPQHDWRYMKECKGGAACDWIPIGPSGRYLHTAITYVTWSHEHAYENLCAGEENLWPERCAQEKDVCHRNLTCLGGIDEYFNGDEYANVRGRYYYKLSKFFEVYNGEKYYDNNFEPMLPMTHDRCPPDCCMERRLCLRVNDVLGYEVPFDRTMMLVFGGKTYTHDYVPENGIYTPGDNTGKELIYHMCEDMPNKKKIFQDYKKLRSCLEETVDELWRYDTFLNEWHYLKFETSKSETSEQMVGTPTARYGHSAALVIYEKAVEPDNVRRQYMYIFGGAAQQCRFGLCDDLWRYEIPWAAVAYYPQFPGRGDDVDLFWQRGNKWFLKQRPYKLCPYGKHCGRFRHSMVASWDFQFLFVFGGQGIGEWEDSLFRYRIYTDMWEDLAPMGIKAVKRFAFNYQNQMAPVTLDASFYDPELDDQVSPLVQQLCEDCGAEYQKKKDGGHLPAARGDTRMISFQENFPLMIFGGFATEWSYQIPLPEGYHGNVSSVARDFNYDTIDPDFERTRYYFDDTWVYTQGKNIWQEHKKGSAYSRPKSRRGHSLVVRRQITGDAQAIMYGGQQQDEPLSDLWIYDIERPVGIRKWQRLDNTFHLAKDETPGKLAFHSAVWTEELNRMIVFGGITWTQTDLNETDSWRDRDRRCFKAAKDLPSVYHDTMMRKAHPDEEMLVLKGYPAIAADLIRSLKENCAVRRLCCELADNMPEPQSPDERTIWNYAYDPNNPDQCLKNFKEPQCRRLVIPQEKVVTEVVDQTTGQRVQKTYDLIVRSGPAKNYFDLTVMSTLCRDLCVGEMFIPDFRPNLQLGVWNLRPDKCPNECSGNGVCEFSHCVCNPGWTGPDCSVEVCPGSTCYTDPDSQEYFCLECSQRGSCVSATDYQSGKTIRKCVCHAGWAGEDCSMAACYKNCSSTTTEFRGYCSEEYPANQCICAEQYEGLYCERKLCLNKCSQNGVCIDGKCVCDEYWQGLDCSVITFQPGRVATTKDDYRADP